VRVRAYIEDDRWAFAVSLTPGCSPSQIVQAGLVRLIENHYSAGVANSAGSMEAARRRHGDLAEKVYAAGYQAGLGLCAKLEWAQLDFLAGEGWQQAAIDAISETTTARAAAEDPNMNTNLYRTGLRDALSNVWRGTRAAVENSARLIVSSRLTS
jgi:hypothetical protein